MNPGEKLLIVKGEINAIMESGEKYDTGITVTKWEPYAYYAKTEIDGTVYGDVDDFEKLDALSTRGERKGIEVVFKTLYFPAKQHKKKRIAKKWQRKYGFIERSFCIESQDCRMNVYIENSEVKKSCWGLEKMLILDKREYKAVIDMEDIKYFMRDKHITWKEFERVKEEINRLWQ